MIHTVTERVDVAVVGGGIVGLATARAVLAARPGATVVVLEKEAAVGTHQSGRSSGVLHTGAFDRPGSARASMVQAGRAELLELCDALDLPVEIVGKVIIATDDADVARLGVLAERAACNGAPHELVGATGLREIEPFARGVAALHLPGAAIVDFAAICRALAREVRAAGGEVRVGTPVHGGSVDRDGIVLRVGAGTLRARVVVTCGGLHADRLAARLGCDLGGVRIVPFRGDFRALRPDRAHLVRGLVYPVPDPRFPFLGVHLTRDLHGGVHVGPNAVLALAREGYRRGQRDPAQIVRTLFDPAMRRLAGRHWRTGLAELRRASSDALFAASARSLIAGIGPGDLTSLPSGVRAQAVRDDGTLLDDFAFGRGHRVVSVLNAPSPAATASLAIGRHVADLALAWE